jgi:hypothetical protein
VWKIRLFERSTLRVCVTWVWIEKLKTLRVPEDAAARVRAPVSATDGPSAFYSHDANSGRKGVGAELSESMRYAYLRNRACAIPKIVDGIQYMNTPLGSVATKGNDAARNVTANAINIFYRRTDY